MAEGMQSFERIDVVNDNLAMWGVVAADYQYGDTRVDFQDLMVKITEKRATAIEGEVNPLSKRIRNRNSELDLLGAALACMSDYSAQFTDDKKKASANISDEAKRGLELVGITVESGSQEHSQSEVDKWTQLLKTAIDTRNNKTSQDMSRLQSLVDRRDESYSTATSLMQAIGDARSSLIKNL